MPGFSHPVPRVEKKDDDGGEDFGEVGHVIHLNNLYRNCVPPLVYRDVFRAI